MTTHVYVDVDGVLNAVVGGGYRDIEWGWSQESRRSKKINGYTITWSTELVDELNKLARLPGVEMHWLTTWEHDAATKIAPALGLEGAGEWNVFEDRHSYANRYGWWKLNALQDHIEAAHQSDDRVVWLDDDLNFYASAREWADERVSDGTLVYVGPSTRVGLTKHDLTRLHAWVAGD